MTRIGRTQGPNGPDKARGPDRAQGPEKVGNSDFIKSVAGSGDVGRATGPDAALRARIFATIRDGIGRSLPKAEILKEVIGSELQAAFGDRVGPAVKDSVSAAFEDEPRLRALFDDIYDRATRGA